MDPVFRIIDQVNFAKYLDFLLFGIETIVKYCKDKCLTILNMDSDVSISTVLDELHQILDVKVEPVRDKNEGVMNVLNEIEDIIDNEASKKTKKSKETDGCDEIVPSKSKYSPGHRKPRNIQCRFCEYKAVSIRGLKKHTTLKHKDQQKGLLRCKVCGSQFTQDELYRHYFRSHGKLIEEERIDLFIDKPELQKDINLPFKYQICN